MLTTVVSTYLDLYKLSTLDQQKLLKTYSRTLGELITLIEDHVVAPLIELKYQECLIDFKPYSDETEQNELETAHLIALADYVAAATKDDFSAEKQADPSNFLSVLKNCAAGDDIVMADGEYPRFSVDTTKQYKLHAANTGLASIKRHTVSGSGTIPVKKNNRLGMFGIKVNASDLACFLFDNPHGAFTFDDFTFEQCECAGTFDPTSTATPEPSKWGFLTYALNNFSFSGGSVHSLEKEHAFYHHNIQGPMTIENAKIYHCGRTAVQIVARTNEGPMGSGTIHLRNLAIEDVCLENGGGGSAISINGGHNGDIFIEGCSVKLGCNQDLVKPYSNNITGGFASFFGGGSYSVKPNITIAGCYFEVGKFYTGSGYARRPNLQVGYVKEFTLVETQIIQHPGAREAIAFSPGSIDHMTLDSKNQVTGEILWGKTRYHTYAEFLEAVKNDPKMEVI